MALQATYGNPQAFNIKIYDLAGGGYYAVLFDNNTQVFQRRGNATDSRLYVSGVNAPFYDRFTSWTYDAVNKILTLIGATDIYQGAQFTRKEIYRFVSDYVVEDTWSIVCDKVSCGVGFTNWNYYTSVNAIWDIDNTNFGDGTSFKQLGIGIQLTPAGSIYGVVSDSEYGVQKNNEKRALASQLGIACNWVVPGDGQFSLTPNVPLNLKQWFFKSKPVLYDFMLQATLAMAAGLNFTGTLWEKVCKVTVYNNTGLFSDLVSIKLNPASKYANGMWMRDSFWASFLLTNNLEQQSMAMFETNQNVFGQIATTMLGPSSPSFSHDESTMLYIIRAYYNKVRRNLPINITVVNNALTYILAQVVNDEYRNINSNFQTWMDTFTFANGGYSGYNQGLYCVVLKCCLLLGLNITQAQIDNATNKYKALYDVTNKYIKFTNDTGYLATDVLTGDALSIWLFNTPLLLDQMVSDHITKMVAVANTPYGLKCICNLDGTYVTFGGNSAGDYQSGGSWFLYEYLAYYSALYHKYPNAYNLINTRINQELSVDPVSHEFLQTSNLLPQYGSEPADRHVYSWNAAAITISLTPNLPSVNNFFGTKLAEGFA